ncbi:MAG TPA: CpXC domain-containing protein [Rhizomicrobium sp.]
MTDEVGRRGFHGRIATLADACAADYLVVVTCEKCGAKRQMHPYKIMSRRKALTEAALDTPLPGFHCRACGRKASVTISCLHKHPGSL